ncbi:MAG: type II toxin-antitoxin system VapC family toxin [Planctomycetota bacterium]
MAKSVYIETTIPSYLTGRPTRDLLRAAHQEITREWWEDHRGRFDLFVSRAVIEEAGRGNSDAVKRRLDALQGLPLLEMTEEVFELARSLLETGVLPQRARIDAVHIAVAAVHGIDILLTWNCKHLANGEIMGAVARHLWSRGYAPPVICMPDELMGGDND